MKSYILAGVGTVTAYTQGTSAQKILTTQTTQDQGMSLGVTAEDIRGGLSNPLLGRYFHDSILELNITDALFNLQYVALNAGGNITVGGDAIEQETVTTTVANEITVVGTPVAFGDAGLAGWYKVEGSDTWNSMTFVGQTATVTDLEVGTTVCVEYNATNDALQQFKIKSAIIPSEVHVIMAYPLFAAGTTTAQISQNSQVGQLIIDIPRFQFSGTMDLALTSSGASTSALSGSALASYQVTNCEDMGTYATVSLDEFGANWYDGLIAMGIDDAVFTMASTDNKTLRVTGIYEGGKTGLVNNANLTFTTDVEGTATVSNAGVVSGVAAGTAHITAVATDKTSVEAVAVVTVE